MKRFRTGKTILAAFSMFSAIPMPQLAWDDEMMKGLLGAFPLVGLAVGGVSGLWVFGCTSLQLPQMLKALGLFLIPLMITGGIHLDGCCDTWDALASHAEAARKREILKDPHMGSFAGWKMTAMLLTQFVLWFVLREYKAVPVLAGYVLSRSLSAIAVASFPIAQGSGMARSFSEGADRKKVLWTCTAMAAVCLILMAAEGEPQMVLAAAGVFAWYRYRLVPEFEGLSGDLAGWFVQTAELWMLAAMVLSEAF